MNHRFRLHSYVPVTVFGAPVACCDSRGRYNEGKKSCYSRRNFFDKAIMFK